MRNELPEDDLNGDRNILGCFKCSNFNIID